jgi:hypothetical protein
LILRQGRKPEFARATITDLLIALGEHLLLASLWLLLTAGVGESIPLSQHASTASTVMAWSLVAALPLAWIWLGGMLILWWRQSRGPLWSYPWIWVLMAFLFAVSASAIGMPTFIVLIGLWFPKVRKGLVPAHLATTK